MKWKLEEKTMKMWKKMKNNGRTFVVPSWFLACSLCASYGKEPKQALEYMQQLEFQTSNDPLEFIFICANMIVNTETIYILTFYNFTSHFPTYARKEGLFPSHSFL